MHHAVRHENGKVISDPEWQSICQAAFTVARSHLDPLRRDPRAIPEKMHRKTFLKGAFLNEWLDTVTALERLCPLLSLCTGNWKGNMVLSSVPKSCLWVSPTSQPSTPSLISSSCPPPSSQVTSSSRAAASCPSTPSSVAPRRPSELSPRCTSFKSPHPQPRAPAQSPREPESASKAGSKAKRRRDPSPPQRNGKCSKANEGASGTSAASDPVQRSPSLRPAFMLLLQPDPASQSDHATSHTKVPSTRAAKARGNRAVATNDDDDMATKPVSGSHPVTPVEDPGCQSPSYENSSEPAPSKTTRSKQDLATSHAKAPSTRAAKAKSNCSAVTDGNDDVAAQPVSGSRPVTPGARAQDGVPKSRSEWRLQFERTCPPPKTTRSKSDHASSSAKAPSTRAAKAKDNRSTTDNDAAAQSQPKSRLVTPTEDPRHKSPDQAGMAPSSSEHLDDDDESHSHLQVLLHDELRQWVDEHKIESQGKRPTRIDLIKAIAGAAKSEQPSKEDIESIVTEHKSKRSMKAA
ncbi:hypothetical protein EDB85DRAFT_2140105 [Lactarius pseudohatsudake]|nr:hypothetical protein EDB85DRAFT_2140105 [Lactarius pseudohatsudake]